jgi:seryl-tRNA synthetase
MGACGATVFFHKLAGYEVTSEAIQPQPQTTAEMFLMVAKQAVEQERRTKALEVKLAQIKATQQKAIASLDEVAEPEVEAEELTTRAKLNRLVRDYSAANAVHFQEVWRRVYREFRDRYHVDLKQRAKNIQANGGRKFTSLDVCEQLGKIEELYAVAFEVLKA